MQGSELRAGGAKFTLQGLLSLTRSLNIRPHILLLGVREQGNPLELELGILYSKFILVYVVFFVI